MSDHIQQYRIRLVLNAVSHMGQVLSSSRMTPSVVLPTEFRIKWMPFNGRCSIWNLICTGKKAGKLIKESQGQVCSRI